MGWVKRRRAAGGGGRAGEKRRRKIGPMVIDYLPRIPRIPYSDRPHGPKIEPSITGAPLSFFSLSLSRLLLLLSLPPLRPAPPTPRSSSRSTYSLGRFSGESAPSSIFSYRATKDILPRLGNVALIKRAPCFGTCYRNTPLSRSVPLLMCQCPIIA